MDKARTDTFVPEFSAYPDLVVIMLGMKVRTLYGLKTLMGFKSPIDKAGLAKPDGLLRAENSIVFGLFPLHMGMRWYWRDLAALEAWSRSEPHKAWWTAFMKDTQGTGIWHETYHMRGGMEAIYGKIDSPIGFSAFMPMVSARGSIRSRHEKYRDTDLGALPVENMPETATA